MSGTAVINDVIPRSDILKRAARIGAEILNIKLSGDLPDQTVSAITRVLHEHKVIFFRDQGHLDDAEQERVALRLGKLVPPMGRVTEGTASVLKLDSACAGHRADAWHIDLAFFDAYPKITMTRGAVIPAFGGDTIWSNTAAAYLDLPPQLQRLADELWAVHSNALDAAVMAASNEADKKFWDDIMTRTIYETEHPVVRVLPETGERTLVLGSYLQRFVGVERYDGQRLFDLFHSHVTAPENTVRWTWKEGDVAIWDNRATEHYGIRDYGEQHRVVCRSTIEAELPVSVHGQCSVTHVKAKKQPIPNVG
ncbi:MULTISPECIES: TauD/TfdA family dioxygenase [unclassified Bradyrhizobium]|uniref:TauD/TfdA dioxygenase family protein n=1 Tax=unclassified Bradyrhizobium TaxID=2631580 RepID=UPI00247AD127|nr:MULTISPECIES: TauD/TfdA family dioxygenase [unclassified Bradyrhizobium]WGS24012.1 TauD/TfdA family dioxygenase [Bradyrhizobium sp. ISRA463]WGS31324.1 TauD/TfdA family dioxygenase [Bradyrhizobium sp. ISRA464]